MQAKNNKISFLSFLIEAVVIIKQLWKIHRRQSDYFIDIDLLDEEAYATQLSTRMRPIDPEMLDALLSQLMEEEFTYCKAPWQAYHPMYDLGIEHLIYQGNRKYELVRYSSKTTTNLPENSYLYAYDQRRENIRKLGKPALGLSPPF